MSLKTSARFFQIHQALELTEPLKKQKKTCTLSPQQLSPLFIWKKNCSITIFEAAIHYKKKNLYSFTPAIISSLYLEKELFHNNI